MQDAIRLICKMHGGPCQDGYWKHAMEELKSKPDGLLLAKVCKDRAETFLCLEWVQSYLALGGDCRYG